MRKLNNIFLIGPTGAGKSTIGKLLAQELKLNFYDSDQEIAKKAGADIQWIFDVEGEQGFRLREEQTITELTALSGIVLATGAGVVLAANNRAMLASKGKVIYLQVSLEAQQARVEHSHERPLLNKGDLAITLSTMRAQRTPLYTQLADFVILTDQLSARMVVENIVQKLNE